MSVKLASLLPARCGRSICLPTLGRGTRPTLGLGLRLIRGAKMGYLLNRVTARRGQR